MKKINAIYFINAIDEHLATVNGKSWDFPAKTYEEAFESSYDSFNDERTYSANHNRDAYWYDAAEFENDAFAAATYDDEEFQRVVEKAVEYRDAIAHGLFYEGDLKNGEIELSDRLYDLFKTIEPNVVENNEYFDSFNRIEDAMRKEINARWRMSRTSFGRMLLNAKLYEEEQEFDGFDYELAARVWKANEIRNRYVHTGRLSDDDRAFCANVAHDLCVKF